MDADEKHRGVGDRRDGNPTEIDAEWQTDNQLFEMGEFKALENESDFQQTQKQ
ncbi:hypothetical protein LLG10_02445 [bacterium]|nr:hypothetical protein [bacterium]